MSRSGFKPPIAKVRADRLLVERNLAPSRQRAQSLILAGKVFSDTVRIEKSGQRLPADAPLRVQVPDHPYVSRGGVKLAGALDSFEIDIAGKVALDIGSSTGGFTDCLLQRGATRVYAVDVGYGQLAARLRADPRVIVLERLNARHLTAEHVPEPVDLITVDVSFISATKVLAPATSLLAPGGIAGVLVKPQFEVGRDEVGKGGVVLDDEKRRSAVDAVARAGTELGLAEMARGDSVLAGPKGNVEIFLWLRKGDA